MNSCALYQGMASAVPISEPLRAVSPAERKPNSVARRMAAWLKPCSDIDTMRANLRRYVLTG
jgi:hypothetical protein